MSHLHIPDGVLPAMIWIPALVLALLMLALTGARERRADPRQVAFRGALGALVLAAMSLHIPLGPIEYHLSLLGVVGVLLGAAGAFQVVFVVSAMLALVGHGGLTVIGLNALVLGLGAAVARPVYLKVSPRHGVAAGFAAGAALAQLLASTSWIGVMFVAVRMHPAGAAHDHVGHHSSHASISLVVALLLLLLLGVVVETVVARGMGRFLARVRPESLPDGGWPWRRDDPQPGAANP